MVPNYQNKQNHIKFSKKIKKKEKRNCIKIKLIKPEEKMKSKLRIAIWKAKTDLLPTVPWQTII